MVDMIALLISHGLLVLTAWRLIARDDLDDEAPPAPGIARRKGKPDGA